MRIAQVDLQAFGHFTGRRLRFEAVPDFHITYGPNEAGKTTLSRALKAALFGIPERTADNFVHANANLRVGVVLTRADGESLAVMRRKARKNSLVAYQPQTGEELGEAIPDERLSAWLGGLTEGLYGSMFGLNHEELVAGGKALSEGKGEIGQTLFEAGAGLTSIRALRERLEKEADSLFRPRAPTTAIFKILDQYCSARKEAKEAQTKPAEWSVLRKAVDEAKKAYDQVREQQEQLQRETRRLERLAAVLPDVAARNLGLERLAALGEVRRLPTQAGERRSAAETLLRQAESALREALANLESLQAERDAVNLPEFVLGEGGSIEALYYNLEAYRTARDAVATAQGRIGLAEGQTITLLAAMGEPSSGDLSGLIPGATLRARVQSLANEGAKLQVEWEAAVRQSKAAKSDLAEADEELADLGPQTVPVPLSEALKAFESQGNPQTQAEDLAGQVAKGRVGLELEAAALWDGPIETLVAMVTPLPAELQGFRESQAKLETRKQSLKEAIEKNEDDLAAVMGELEGLIQQGEVPTAEHMARQRLFRDELWQKIRRRVYDEASDGGAQVEKLPTSKEYEWAVQVADATADSRFADAARVSEHAGFIKRIAQMRHAIELDRQRLALETQATEGLQLKWRALLEKHGLPSMQTAELTEWLARRELFVQRYLAWIDLGAQAQAATDRTAKVLARLSASLNEAGLPVCGEQENLAVAIQRARTHVEQTGKAATTHRLLVKKKAKAEAKLAEAAEQIQACDKSKQAWCNRWALAMAEIRLAEDACPEEATVRLGQFDTLEKALATLGAARAELEVAQATVMRVEQEAARLCQVLRQDPANRPSDAIIETLHGQLNDAKAKAQRLQVLAERIDEAAKSRSQAEATIRQARQELDGLRAAAGCDTLAELVEVENRNAQAASLEAEVAAAESRLVAASALPLPILLAQAEGQDLALVQTALERACEDLRDCTTEVEALHRKLMEIQAGLDKIDGEALAGEAEQKAAAAAAQLSHRVSGYASARLASAVLAHVIETYQQRHQAPLLARASQLFAAITGGRFAKVATDFEDAMTILVGVRPNGRRETVGNLSSGTRDQLFLALRLAAIETHVANQGPMPVVVDDIVINFDDDSASATFQVLAELSKKTQVLFFTHHEHLLERAATAIGREAFVAHRLAMD